MDGKVQSGFCLTPGGIPQAKRIGVVRQVSAVRKIHLTPLHIFRPIRWDTAACLLSRRDMPSFGVSAHLVGGLWGGDGGGAAVDQGGQLVEADDAEEIA